MSIFRHEFEVEGGLQPFPLELLTTESCSWGDAHQREIALATRSDTPTTRLVRIWLTHEDVARNWTPNDNAWAARSWKVTGNKRLIRVVGEEEFYIYEMSEVALEIPRFIVTPRQVIEQLGGSFSQYGDQFVIRVERLNLQLRYVLRDERYRLDAISELG